jgi:alkanesulfonate monooxygenase SsuD/methylene tetrahydromethanopterin reductase-like flavin-dependent oxidoreductase (luciferase family)
VHAHSVAGTPDDCRAQLESFVKGGLNLPILLPTGTQDGRKQVVRMARELVS